MLTLKEYGTGYLAGTDDEIKVYEWLNDGNDDEMHDYVYIDENGAVIRIFNTDGGWKPEPLDDYSDALARKNDGYITLPKHEQLLSITEAADILEVTRQRVHQMIQAGYLDGAKVGSTWVIYADSVRLFKKVK